MSRLRIETVEVYDYNMEARIYIDGAHVHTETHKSAFWAGNNALCWVEDHHPELKEEAIALCQAPF